MLHSTRPHSESRLPLPEPGSLRVGPAPHCRSLAGLVPITLTFILAACGPVAAGLVLFGWYGLRVLVMSVTVALLMESAFNVVKGRSRSWSESHALLIGMLLGCTLPPTVSWYVPLLGAAIAVVIGESLAGGVGNYMWHPVAIGRIALQMLFPAELSPNHWPVLGPGKLFWGSLEQAVDMPRLGTWSNQPLPNGMEAWRMVRPIDHLHAALPADASHPASAIVAFVRDAAPPWRDTLLGLSGGAIGEACVAAILVASILLVWRGFLRWPMIGATMGAVIITAILLPVRVRVTGQPPAWCPWPGLMLWNGLPVGAAYVAFHLTAGSLPFVLFMLAADPSSTPLASRGHAIFGAILGAASVVLTVAAGLPAAPYWALLLANSLVPLINRLTRRRVMWTR